jgi:hypothetical protein
MMGDLRFNPRESLCLPSALAVRTGGSEGQMVRPRLPAEYAVIAGEFRNRDFWAVACIPARMEDDMFRFDIDSVQSMLLALSWRRATIGEAHGSMTKALR